MYINEMMAEQLGRDLSERLCSPAPHDTARHLALVKDHHHFYFSHYAVKINLNFDY
jgi:hypothetical protein